MNRVPGGKARPHGWVPGIVVLAAAAGLALPTRLPESRLAEAAEMARARTGPEACRAAPIDPLVLAVPTSVQALASGPVDAYLDALVRYLVSDTSDDFVKVKRIHDWIADNIAYDTEAFFTGKHSAAGAEDTFRSGKAVCQGYSGLFEKMCEMAGFEAPTVSGYGRGYSSDLFQPENPEKSNHAWNTVRIAGAWYLVDATWDAGHVSDRRFVKKYSTSDLFAAPEEFVHTHFPRDSKYQLLSKPLSADEFTDLPWLESRFFGAGLEPLTRLHRVETVAGETRLEVAAPPEMLLDARLETAEGKDVGARQLLKRWGRGRVTLDVRFPTPGNWSLQLFARPKGAKTGWSVAKLGFVATSGSSRRFPVTTTSYDDVRAALVEPLDAPLGQSVPIKVRVRAPRVHGVNLLVDGRWVPMARVPGTDDYAVELRVPPRGSASVLAKLGPADPKWWTLVQY